MNKTAYYADRSISSHVYANRQYEKHIQALRNIYTSDSVRRLKKRSKARKNEGSSSHSKNMKFSRKFCKRSNKQCDLLEQEKNVKQENLRIQGKLESIKLRTFDSRNNINPMQDQYRMAAHFQKEKQKINQCNSLNNRNKFISGRLASQKGKISIKDLEKDYRKNRQYVDRLSRLKVGKGKRTVMSNALVYEGGRYRMPGSRYTSKNEMRDKVIRASSSRSRRSSRSRSRSRRGSRLLNSSKKLKNTSVMSSTYSGKFFKVQTVPALSKQQQRVPTSSKKRRGSALHKQKRKRHLKPIKDKLDTEPANGGEENSKMSSKQEIKVQSPSTQNPKNQ